MLNGSQKRKLRRAVAGPNRLRVALVLAGRTQVWLGSAMQLPQSQISQDAAGKSRLLTLEKARKYADVFGVTVDELFPRVPASGEAPVERRVQVERRAGRRA